MRAGLSPQWRLPRPGFNRSALSGRLHKVEDEGSVQKHNSRSIEPHFRTDLCIPALTFHLGIGVIAKFPHMLDVLNGRLLLLELLQKLLDCSERLSRNIYDSASVASCMDGSHEQSSQ
jgi:hypothetical protein